MNDTEMQNIIDDNSAMIYKMAIRALWKLKRPTYIGLDDLTQEARIASMGAIRAHEKDPKASVQSYIFKHTLRVLCNIVKVSWLGKNDNAAYYHDKGYKLYAKNSPVGLAKAQEFLDSLTDNELKYVQTAVHLAAARGIVVQSDVYRKLGITRYQQRNCLKKIHQKAVLAL